MIQLNETYIPEEFLHRAAQINIIESSLLNFKKYNTATNLIILGTTGAGKTSVVKKILSENPDSCFVSAAGQNTTRKILNNIVKTDRHACSDLLQSSIEDFKKNPRPLIIDEVGKITDRENFDNIINAFYRETQVPIILITNRWTFIEEMPDDARLTLLFERVEFPCYNAAQVYDILKYRLDLISSDDIFKISECSLRYLAGKIVKEHFSSMRIALGTIRNILTRRDDSLETIDYILNQVKEQEWRNFLHKLNVPEKDFLNVVLDLAEDKIEIPVSEVHNKLPNLSPSRISQLTTCFVDYGILKAKYKNTGRSGGNYRIIEFASPTYREKLLKLLNPWEDFEPMS